MTKLFKWFLVLSLLFSADVLLAQNSKFTIKGRVTDGKDKPLVGVCVMKGSMGAYTDRDGYYVLRNVPRGEVNLTTMYYSAYQNQNLNFVLKQDTTINLSLKEDALNMDEVVITGTRTEKRLSETPVQTTVIKDREIRKAGAVSTLEILQDNLPGLVSSSNAMGNNMRIKGLNSRYILFLVDGERLVSEGAGGNINLDQIDVNTIDHIEVINGAASALYGSNAVGAVVNIITKRPFHKFEGGAEVIGESHNTWKTKVNVGSNLEKITTRVSAFRNSSDGFVNEKNHTGVNRFTDWGTNLDLGYRPMDRLELKVLGRFFSHETFNPADVMNNTHGKTHTLAVGGNVGYVSRDRRNSMKLSVNYDKYFDYEVFENLDTKEKDNTASYISTRFTNTFNANDKFSLVGGIEYNNEEVFATTTLGPEPTTKTINDGNLFAQAEWEIFKNFDLVTGARYTYNEQFKSAFTPKLSLMYELGRFKFRGGIGSAFRAPSIKELYYDFDHQGMFWIHGNPNLKAEKGMYTSLSVEYTHNNLNASLSGYYNDIDNKITQYDTYVEEDDGLGNLVRRNHKYYENVSSATLKGFDFNFSWIFLHDFTLKGTYSFCDAKDNNTGLQLSSNVRHSATASITWNGKIARSPFSLQFAGRVNSPILYQSQTLNPDGTYEVSKEESDTYSVWKVTLVKPFRIKKHTLELTFKCDNIFGFEEESFVNPGRQFLFGLRYAFK